MFLTLCTVVLGAWFGFANPVWQLPPTVLLYPAGVALLGYRATTWQQALWLGTVTGSLVSATCLYWIAVPVHDFGGLSWMLAIPCPLLLGVYIGLYTGLFCLGIYHVAGRLPWWAFGSFAGALWTILEALRGYLFTGFAWLTLSSAFVLWPAMIQTVAFWGSWGLSAVLATVACLPIPALCSIMSEDSHTDLPGWQFLTPGLTTMALLVSLWLLGNWWLNEPIRALHSLRISLVQGNIDQGHKWNPAYQLATMEHYIKLSRYLAVEHRPQLLLWPETAMPFFFQEEGPLSIMVRRLAAETRIPLLAGSPCYVKPERDKSTGDALASRTYSLFNRAWLLDDYGRTTSYYDKEHLVPFGEYVPLPEWLQKKHYFAFFTNLLQGIGNFVPGCETAPLDLPLPTSPAGTGPGNLVKLGILICYETIFPELAQKRVAAGATLIVNISNDAWFGYTAAPRQHLHLSVLRAVEQGRYLVRATNTGISAVIDPRGRLSQETKLFEPAAVLATVQIINDRTLFHRIFIIVLPCLGIIAIIFFLWAMVYPARGYRLILMSRRYRLSLP